MIRNFRRSFRKQPAPIRVIRMPGDPVRKPVHGAREDMGHRVDGGRL